MPSSLTSSTTSHGPARGSTTISCGLMLAPVYCPGPQGKQHHAFQPHEQHHFSWPARSSTTISCRLMTAPVYCPGLKASSTMPSSLTSSTTSRGQHTAAPPYPACS
uniref:Uncharacterized protein n=1 Tax=Haemonchus contortus TaxID=6289 RepID=A0A7I4YFT8_HAECO